jgi:hypothetical protein
MKSDLTDEEKRLVEACMQSVKKMKTTRDDCILVVFTFTL